MQSVIGEAGFGLVRTRALTTTKNGEDEVGSRIGDVVLSVRPILTIGSGWLYDSQRNAVQANLSIGLTDERTCCFLGQSLLDSTRVLIP